LIRLQPAIVTAMLLLASMNNALATQLEQAVKADGNTAIPAAMDQAYVDSLIKRIADLEVEKTLQSQRFTPDSPVVVNLNREQATLEARLQELTSADYQPQLAATIVRALEAKRAEIRLQYDRDRMRFTDDHPFQRQKQAQLRRLDERLMSLK
jgi:hypothetical protein